jgi:hypothetical protein
MAPRLSHLLEELWCAPPRCPTSFGRWDIRPREANLVEEPWHLVHADLGH